MLDGGGAEQFAITTHTATTQTKKAHYEPNIAERHFWQH